MLTNSKSFSEVFQTILKAVDDLSLPNQYCQGAMTSSWGFFLVDIILWKEVNLLDDPYCTILLYYYDDDNFYH